MRRDIDGSIIHDKASYYRIQVQFLIDIFVAYVLDIKDPHVVQRSAKQSLF